MRDGARDILELILEQALQLEQVLDPLGDGHATPARKGPAGGLNSRVDLRGWRKGRAAKLLAGGRIEDREALDGGGLPPFTLNVVAHGCSLYPSVYRHSRCAGWR